MRKQNIDSRLSLKFQKLCCLTSYFKIANRFWLYLLEILGFYKERLETNQTTQMCQWIKTQLCYVLAPGCFIGKKPLPGISLFIQTFIMSLVAL